MLTQAYLLMFSLDLKEMKIIKFFFLTGTDEHGLKIQKAAEKANLDPIKYCDKISKVFKDLTNKLNLSNDDFIRNYRKKTSQSGK